MIKNRYDFHVLHKVPLELVQLETNKKNCYLDIISKCLQTGDKTDLFSVVPNHIVPGFFQNASIANSKEEKIIKESLYKDNDRVKHIFLKWLMPTLPQNVL